MNTRLAAHDILTDPRLGRVPDRVLASEHGVNIRTVWEARTNAGVPCYERVRRHCLLASTALGNEPDRVVAERYGYKRETVCEIRLEAGIAAYVRPIKPRTLIIMRHRMRTVLDWLDEHDTAHTAAEVAVAVRLPVANVYAALVSLAGLGRVERIDGRPALWVIA